MCYPRMMEYHQSGEWKTICNTHDLFLKVCEGVLNPEP